MPKDFSRDLGYLDKFLQGLREHAATLGAPGGSRLLALLDEQDQAWGEIRGILAGGSGASSESGKASTSRNASTTDEASAAPAAGAAIPEVPSKRLTVGSLMS